jgi:hypothetical protein
MTAHPVTLDIARVRKNSVLIARTDGLTIEFFSGCWTGDHDGRLAGKRVSKTERRFR